MDALERVCEPRRVELLFSVNPGCAAAESGGGSAPRQCGAAEAAAVPHRYQYPRPHAARLYVCAAHARGEPAEPLTEEDRRVIAERHARQAALLEPARRAGRLPERLR